MALAGEDFAERFGDPVGQGVRCRKYVEALFVAQPHGGKRRGVELLGVFVKFDSGLQPVGTGMLGDLHRQGAAARPAGVSSASVWRNPVSKLDVRKSLRLVVTR
jgi:hypothetical protein